MDDLKSEITLDDIRHKVLKIREDVTAEVKTQTEDRRNQIIAGAVLGVVVIVGLAYYLGTRSKAVRKDAAAFRSA
jgi:hypothetical protein